MSKESKSRDRFRQSIEAAQDRPVDYCVGCGYANAVNGSHRADCTARQPCSACNAPTVQSYPDDFTNRAVWLCDQCVDPQIVRDRLALHPQPVRLVPTR